MVAEVPTVQTLEIEVDDRKIFDLLWQGLGFNMFKYIQETPTLATTFANLFHENYVAQRNNPSMWCKCTV